MAGVVSINGGGPWAKSRALLGSIADVDRARVSDLVNPEPDRPLAPHWRVHCWDWITVNVGLVAPFNYFFGWWFHLIVAWIDPLWGTAAWGGCHETHHYTVARWNAFQQSGGWAFDCGSTSFEASFTFRGTPYIYIYLFIIHRPYYPNSTGLCTECLSWSSCWYLDYHWQSMINTGPIDHYVWIHYV